MLTPMDFIPKPFMEDINYSTRDIGKKYYSQSKIIAAGNKKNNYSVRNEYNKPECNRFDDRPVEMFVKPPNHKYTIADNVELRVAI